MNILNPLSPLVDIAAASDVDNAPLVSVLNTTGAPIYVAVDGGPNAVAIAAGERVLIEKDNFPATPVTIQAFTAADLTGAPAAGTVWATKVAYAG